jgi:hypothetical protein
MSVKHVIIAIHVAENTSLMGGEWSNLQAGACTEHERVCLCKYESQINESYWKYIVISWHRQEHIRMQIGKSSKHLQKQVQAATNASYTKMVCFVITGN